MVGRLIRLFRTGRSKPTVRASFVTVMLLIAYTYAVSSNATFVNTTTNNNNSITASATFPAPQGKLYYWGRISYSGSSYADSSSPVLLDAATTWAVASVGSSGGCALKSPGASGTVWCWGTNASGQVGDTTTTARPSMVQVTTPTSTGWSALSRGFNHACGINTNGANANRLYCWGNTNLGAVGDGTSSGSRATPYNTGGSTQFTSVATGQNHSCAIDTSTNRYCWGNEASGALGNGVTSGNTTSLGSSIDSGWSSISLGGAPWGCGITTANALKCWGYNQTYGALGNGNTTNQASPVTITPPAGSTSWTTVSTGFYTTCAITDVGKLYCWGANNYGQLGNGSHDNSAHSSPVQVGAATDWVDIATTSAQFTTGAFTCGIRSGGTVWCWGWNGSSSSVGIGTGDTTEHDSPTQVTTTVTAAKTLSVVCCSDGMLAIQ